MALGGRQRVNQNDDYVDIQRDKQFPYMHSLACQLNVPLSFHCCESMLSCTDYEICCQYEFVSRTLGFHKHTSFYSKLPCQMHG
jgi:hypothetical protein